MSKRLLKRHKRQVARAKANVKTSEPDVRTPEQIKAAREASQPPGGWGSAAQANRPGPQSRGHAGPSAERSTKGDASA